MIHFTPKLGIKDAAQNANAFIKDNMNTFWDILKPFAPYIIALYIFDVIITNFFMPIDVESDQPKEFSLGSLIANYFYTCLAITWHRVVIHGSENYTAVNPFKPKKSELAFIGMGIALFIAIFIISFLFTLAVKLISSTLMVLILPLTIILTLVWMKFMFYFPSKATGNSITLKQSYKMTNGYVWKLLASYIVASLILLLMTFVYAAAGIITIGLILIPISALSSDIVTTISTTVLSAAFVVPLALYFQPLFAVIWVTILSNYYQYVLQNEAPLTNGSSND